MNRPAVDTAQAPLQPGAAAAQETPADREALSASLGLLLGIAGLAASRLGQLWIAFDVFSQFTLQFGVVAVAFAIGARHAARQAAGCFSA